MNNVSPVTHLQILAAASGPLLAVATLTAGRRRGPLRRCRVYFPPPNKSGAHCSSAVQETFPGASISAIVAGGRYAFIEEHSRGSRMTAGYSLPLAVDVAVRRDDK